MFEGDLGELDTADLLSAASEYAQLQNRAAVRTLEAALAYADRHAVVEGYQWLPGYERMVVYGGEGCPGVAEFAPVEFGAVLRMSSGAAAALIGEALALRHRLPRIWAAVLAGNAVPWRARKVAEACLALSLEAAAVVDRRVVGIVNTVTPGALERIVKAAVWEADPELAKEQAEAVARTRGVFVAPSDDHGTKRIWVRAAAGDVIRFDATIDDLARALKTLGDPDTLDQRRAKAIGWISDPAAAHHLLEVARHLAHTQPHPEPPRTTAPATPAPGTTAPDTTTPDTTAPAATAAETGTADDATPDRPQAPDHADPADPADPGTAAPATTRLRATADAAPGNPETPDHSDHGDPAGRGVSVRRIVPSGEAAASACDWTEPDGWTEPDDWADADDWAGRDDCAGAGDCGDPDDWGFQGEHEGPVDPAAPATGGMLDGDEFTRRALAGELPAPLAAIKQLAYSNGLGAGSGSGGARRNRHTLYVHLTDKTLATGTGVLRVEELGPLLAGQLTELLGHDQIIVKPVIDLHDQVSVHSYEIPDRIRERVRLRHPVDMFPYGAAEATGRMDQDHITPYDRTGPPTQSRQTGQTSTDNLIPLTRTHHRAKTFGGWRSRRLPTGAVDWISPHGFRFVVDHTGTHPVSSASNATELGTTAGF